MPVDRSDRIPAHPPIAKGFLSREPTRMILMTPAMAAIGGLIAFFAVVGAVVILPTTTYDTPPSTNWIPVTNSAARGRNIYLSNGRVYCHSGYSRPQDNFRGLYYLYPRVSEPGDYWYGAESPNVFGTERTGPDLSQEGGQHPHDWQLAHYDNPRNTQPLSIMPVFSFLSDDEVKDLIAFNQSQGGKEATLRTAAQTVGKQLMLINQGIDDPAKDFPDLVNELKQGGTYRPNGSPMDTSPWGLPWMGVWMVNSFQRSYWLTSDPLPVTQENLLKGKEIFLNRCVGCHGVRGDGGGPAIEFLLPNPFNFTDTTAMGVMGPFASDGMFYYRILTGGKGTAMENFGTRLSVEDTWRVVMFLRTIQNDSLETPETIPTVDMWVQWTPPPPLQMYINDHPIIQEPGTIADTQDDPFHAAAHWLSPGLAPGDTVLVGGKLPVDQATIVRLVRNTYFQMVEQAYSDAQGRAEKLPPKEEIMSTDGVVFHAP